MKRLLHRTYVDVPAARPGTVGAYALAFVAAAVATALRVALDPYVVGSQFLTFFPAIVITTVISGFGAGFFCAVLSTAAAYRLVDRGRDLHDELDRAGWADRVSAAAARVWHRRYARDGRAQRGWQRQA
jgi:hypothetical protein